MRISFMSVMHGRSAMGWSSIAIVPALSTHALVWHTDAGTKCRVEWELLPPTIDICDVIARTDSNSTEKNSTPYPALLFTKPLFPQRVMPLPARAGNRCHLTSRECVAVSETTHGAENKVGAPVATDPEAKLSLSHKTGVTPAKPGSQSEYRIVHRPDFYQRDGVETHLNHPACIQTGKVHRSL
jgi:hypothetical protein